MNKYRIKDVSIINPSFDKTKHPSNILVSFVPMAAISDINYRIVRKEEGMLSKYSKGYTYFEKGDLLLAKITPCFENGKIAIADISHAVGFGSTEFYVIRTNPKVILSKYLFYILRSHTFLALGKENMTGSAGQKRLRRDFLENFQISLPSINEQKIIIEILDKAESLQQKRKQSKRLLNDYLKSIFLEMFGNPINNPKKWELKKFGTIGKLDRGISKHRPRNEPELLGGDHPLIQTGDIAKSDIYIESFKSTYSDVGLKQSKKWPKGTLCITIAANIAKTGILNFDSCFPDSVVGFIANNNNTNNEFIHFWISFLQEMLEKNAPESAQKNINLKILRDLDVIMPPVELQNKFSAIVHTTELLKQKMINQSSELETQFQSLMQKTFSSIDTKSNT